LDAVLAGLDVLSATRGRLQRSGHARTLVEMALVRLGRLGDLTSLSQLAQWLGQVRLDPRVAGTQPAPGTATNAARHPAVPPPPEGVKKKPLSPVSEAAPAQDTGPLDLTPESWPLLWPQLVPVVGTMMSSELQKAGLPAISGPNTLVFRFPPAYNQARD